ncbi:hypothetical protein OBBRIDRAFT_789416 [Obba rivulosa]|uniref:Thioredoxin-like fold domain-containing protein n=1 Tax=Obba rivulosa TaxID=1052685 RepID=A0A8E2J485_9APHY|nr:hypothetical protein OBBRIDRAFT_789416 [Obba rivulosa]
MALQPSLRSLVVAGTRHSPHTLDVFLDFVCPYSKKMAFAIETILDPLLGEGGRYNGKVHIIFRPQVQPWHASSTFTHEAALAVLRIAPDKFWAFALALFRKQEEFFDIPSSVLTPVQIRAKLAIIAGTVIGINKVPQFEALLTLISTPNGGVSVTDDLKYTVKFSRQNGIHVSPTVLWDGLVANEISSSWGEVEWIDFLEKNVVV